MIPSSYDYTCLQQLRLYTKQTPLDTTIEYFGIQDDPFLVKNDLKGMLSE